MTDTDRFATLLPKPVSAVDAGGSLVLTGRTPVEGDPDWIEDLRRFAFRGTGVRPTEDGEPRIRLVATDEADADWYRIRIDGALLTIETRDRDGLSRAIATLRQLMPDEAELEGAEVEQVVLPCGVVEDGPHFGWRGVLVDVARHFQPLPWLYRFIDSMASYKFNVLHLHLTDDQGWRLEVPKWPRLTEVGSWRESSEYGEDDDGTPHGGWYSLEQLRALDAYAAGRGITIVPEVDMPGHTRSLLAAYPQFGSGEPTTVARQFRIHSEIMHVTDESLAMMNDIIDVLVDTFHGPWITLGGDESPMIEWERSDEMRRQMERRGLETPRQLEHWLMRHLAGEVERRGRRLVGWDEIVEHGDVTEAVILSWRSSEPGHRAGRRGHDVVMTPQDVVYLDRYQSDDPQEPFALRKITTWQDVAAWDPEGEWPDDATGRLLGVQAGLWGESTRSPDYVEFQAYPRLCVVAEVAWRGRADERGLRERLEAQIRRLRLQGVNARPLDGPLPWQRGGTGARRRMEF